MNLLLKGGRVVDPASGTDELLDVLIEDGKIAKLGKGLAAGGARALDLKGKVVAPGFVDMHVHLREPGQEWKETIETGARAAAAGGFTAVACMPNTVPVNDDRSVTEFIRSRARQTACVRVHPIGAISKGQKGEELAEIGDLVAGGAVAISDDGTARGLRDALPQGARVLDDVRDPGDRPLRRSRPVRRRRGERGVHFDAPRIEGLEPLRRGGDGRARSHPRGRDGRPRSHRPRFDAGKRRAPARGPREGDQGDRRSGPAPLRPHRGGLPRLRYEHEDEPAAPDRGGPPGDPRRGWRTGRSTPSRRITPPTTATTRRWSSRGRRSASSAWRRPSRSPSTGWCTAGSWASAASWSCSPARRAGSWVCPGGRLEPGLDADITVLDLERAVTVDASLFLSKARNTPFDGWKLRGAPVATLVGGNLVHNALAP